MPAESTIGRKYGWKPQPPDVRDEAFAFCAKPKTLAALPAKVDLRGPLMPEVYDQGSLGSCTAQAIGSADHYEQLKLGFTEPFTPSRLFIYYLEREMEGSINEDAGAIIRDGMKCVAKFGVCPETMHPYNIALFKNRPSDECYKSAANHKVTKYSSVIQDLNQLKACLAEGHPIVFGFTVYQSFESEKVAKSGIMSMPTFFDRPMGGHAVKCVGYDDSKKWFIVKNSWGPGWGDKGYFYMPYQYMINRNLASDFWCIKLVEDLDSPPAK